MVFRLLRKIRRKGVEASGVSNGTRGSNERGATMLEYGVMVALILVASVAVVKSIGENVGDSFNFVSGNMDISGG